jgi:hypothetical protein
LLNKKVKKKLEVRKPWLYALDGVYGVVRWSKSSFGGSDRSVLTAPPCLSGKHDIIVSGLASVAFFFHFLSLNTDIFEHYKVNELHVNTNREVVILFFISGSSSLAWSGVEWSFSNGQKVIYKLNGRQEGF